MPGTGKNLPDPPERLDHPAIGAQHLAVDPAALRAGEEGHGGGDVLGRVGVFVNLPLEKARLTHITEGQPLPDFAREIEVESWAQFFLKWVMGHPAVSCVLCGTSNPDHVTDNLGALRGPLPDAEMRARMVRHMETIPGFDGVGTMPWYPGKDTQYRGQIRAAQAEAQARLAD